MSFRPSITMPPPTPVPQKTPRNESSPRPAPNRCSASTATLTSLPIRTGLPSSAASVGPSGNGVVPAVDVRHLEHGARLGVDRARARRRRSRRAPSARRRRRRAPRAAPRRARRQPPPGRPCGASPVARCRAPSTRRSSRPPGSSSRRGRARPSSASRQPSHDLVDRLAVRPRAPFLDRVQLRVARPLRQPEREDDHRRLVLGRASSTVRASSASVIPFGHEASPSGPGGEQHALGRATRVEQHRPLPAHEDRRRRDLPRGRSRAPTRRARAPRSGPGSVGTTNVHGCPFRDEPESLPASSTRRVSSGGSGSGSVRRSSRRLAIASSVSMPSTLPRLCTATASCAADLSWQRWRSRSTRRR